MDTDADSKNGTYRLPCGNGPQEFDDLAGRLERCGKILLHCLGKRRGQEKILRILWEQGESTQKDLQEQLGIQPGSMSEIAAKLAAKGLVARGRAESDRRKILLSLTEEGRTWLARQDEVLRPDAGGAEDAGRPAGQIVCGLGGAVRAFSDGLWGRQEVKKQ